MGNFMKDVVIGDYDWKFLCMPRVPWGKPSKGPPMFFKDDKISLFVAFVMGLQHALCMLGGIITVPLIIAGPFVAGFNDDQKSYVIAAALIWSGISSFCQVTQFKIPGTRYVIGSGLLSVMGVSFTFLPIAQSTIATMRQCACNGVACTVNGTCNDCPVPLTGECNTGTEAYGRLLGTIMVASFLEILLSFAPQKVLRALFPPVVTGTTVTLIGVALGGTGMQYWGGGVYCASQVLTSKVPCTNGEVSLPFGCPEFVGLGFVVFFTLILVELFGSPFLRNVSVVMGLLIGMIVAASVHYRQCTPNCDEPVCTTGCYNLLPMGVSYDNVTNTISGTPSGAPGNSSICMDTCAPATCYGETCQDLRYVTSKPIENAPWITFLWVETFPLGFYAPAILPMLFGFLVTTMECIGDVTAVTEASGLLPYGPGYEQSIQGAILSDGLSGLLGGLATVFPTVTYAENNGVVALTRCAARRAGIAASIILIVLGVFSKFAGIVLTIPDAVLGGMLAFLFINVAVSGVKILTMGDGINRRNRFIAAIALTLGIGVSLTPAWINISGQMEYPLEGNFWPIDPTWSGAMLGFRNAIIIVMSNGFSIGGITAMILNLIVPTDTDDEHVFDEIALKQLEAEKEGGEHVDKMDAPSEEAMTKEV